MHCLVERVQSGHSVSVWTDGKQDSDDLRGGREEGKLRKCQEGGKTKRRLKVSQGRGLITYGKLNLGGGERGGGLVRPRGKRL